MKIKNQIAHDLSLLDTYIEPYRKSLCIENNLYINPSELKFDTLKHDKTNTTLYFTYFECKPYTKTEKNRSFRSYFIMQLQHIMNLIRQQIFWEYILFARWKYWKSPTDILISHTMYSFELGLTGQTLEVKK